MADQLRTIVVAGDRETATALAAAVAPAHGTTTTDLAGLPAALAAGPAVLLCPPADEAAVRAAAPEQLVVATAAGEALREAEHRHQRFVAGLPVISYVAEWSDRTDLRSISPQIEALLGHPPEAFLADQDLWYRCIHPDDVQRVRDEERRCVAAGEDFDHEYRMVARDGGLRWIWDRDLVVRDEDGRPLFSQGVIVDVTALRQAELALREEHERAERFLEVNGTIMAVLGPDGTITTLNQAGHELLGYAPGELVGRNWYETLVPEEERLARVERFRRMLEGEGEEPGTPLDGRLVSRDGAVHAMTWQHALLRDEEGAVTAMVLSGLDLTDRDLAEQQVAYLAYHDSLTGLPNRALLHEHLELAMARARRSGHAIALLYLDLDDFKLVNDSLGHAAGDELLCQIAMRLGHRRRDADLLARHGGDEFLLLLADVERSEAEPAARHVAEEVLSALQPPFRIAGAEFHVGASVGISLYPRDAPDADGLLRHADTAMYESKANGRNGVTVYTGEMHEPLERLSMSSRLRKALARDEFTVHFQPIVDPRDQELHMVEALVRWEDPFRGTVAPGEFIPFAEDTGLIDRIGDWVVDAVVAQLEAWDRAGLAPPTITVNVSPRQLRRPDFARRVQEQAARLAGPGALTVEITESAAMNEPTRVEPALRELHASGIEVAIDDFGAGYSSLTRLRTLPVQVLKIDRSFLRGVPEDPEATAIVTAMVDLAAALGMTAIAEGVETEEQRRFLVDAGCPLAQGFLLGRPMPADELEPRLRRGDRRDRPAVAS